MVNKLTKPRPVERQRPPDPKGQLLGERHKYEASEMTASLAKSAKSIGFSKSEVVELQRLYELECKGRNR